MLIILLILHKLSVIEDMQAIREGKILFAAKVRAKL